MEGVPGFYLHEKGYWTVRFSGQISGILIPAIGIDGLIKGMQILLDTPFKHQEDPPEKAEIHLAFLGVKEQGCHLRQPGTFRGKSFFQDNLCYGGAAESGYCPLSDGKVFCGSGGSKQRKASGAAVCPACTERHGTGGGGP